MLKSCFYSFFFFIWLVHIKLQECYVNAQYQCCCNFIYWCDCVCMCLHVSERHILHSRLNLRPVTFAAIKAVRLFFFRCATSLSALFQLKNYLACEANEVRLFIKTGFLSHPFCLSCVMEKLPEDGGRKMKPC